MPPASLAVPWAIAFFHGLRYGRKSLSLDVVEPFRQPVIDRLTLRLFNRR